MTPWCMDFCKRFGEGLRGEILEVGSYDVNGSVREVMRVTTGADMREGPGVDVVCRAEELVDRFGEESFDHVVTTEMLEHCEDWRKALSQMWAVLRPGGWFILTARGPGFPLHDYPHDYWRFSVEDMRKVYPTGHVEKDTNCGVGVAVVKQATWPQFEGVEVMEVER